MFAIKEGNKMKVQEAKQFAKVLEKEWLIKIGIMASAVSHERNFSIKQELPDPTDIGLLTKYVKNKLTCSTYSVEIPTWKTYLNVVCLVQTRLATYNKRWPGEIERRASYLKTNKSLA